MTNTVIELAQNISYATNWTQVFSITSVAFAIAFGIIGVLRSKKSVSEENLRESEFIKEIKDKSDKIEEKVEEKYENLQNKIEERNENIQSRLNGINIQLECLKLQMTSCSGEIDDLKTDYKDILEKIEEMLRQIKSFLN